MLHVSLLGVLAHTSVIARCFRGRLCLNVSLLLFIDFLCGCVWLVVVGGGGDGGSALGVFALFHATAWGLCVCVCVCVSVCVVGVWVDGGTERWRGGWALYPAHRALSTI